MGCLAVAVGRDGLLLALPLEQALLLRHLPPLMDVSAAPEGLWNRSYAASLELPPLIDAVAVRDALGFFLRLGLWGRSKRTGSAIVGWKKSKQCSRTDRTAQEPTTATGTESTFLGN
jgi:hypothetical protein